jgi:hypothetical protein
MAESAFNALELRNLEQRAIATKIESGKKAARTRRVRDLLAARRGRAQAEADFEAARTRAILDSGRLF